MVGKLISFRRRIDGHRHSETVVQAFIGLEVWAGGAVAEVIPVKIISRYAAGVIIVFGPFIRGGREAGRIQRFRRRKLSCGVDVTAFLERYTTHAARVAEGLDAAGDESVTVGRRRLSA